MTTAVSSAPENNLRPFEFLSMVAHDPANHPLPCDSPQDLCAAKFALHSMRYELCLQSAVDYIKDWQASGRCPSVIHADLAELLDRVIMATGAAEIVGNLDWEPDYSFFDWSKGVSYPQEDDPAPDEKPNALRTLHAYARSDCGLQDCLTPSGFICQIAANPGHRDRLIGTLLPRPPVLNAIEDLFSAAQKADEWLGHMMQKLDRAKASGSIRGRARPISGEDLNATILCSLADYEELPSDKRLERLDSVLSMVAEDSTDLLSCALRGASAGLRAEALMMRLVSKALRGEPA